MGNMKARTSNIKTFWRCEYCGVLHEVLPKVRTRRYCSRKCQAAAYYRRKKEEK